MFVILFFVWGIFAIKFWKWDIIVVFPSFYDKIENIDNEGSSQGNLLDTDGSSSNLLPSFHETLLNYKNNL
jgi:hypothetical protein